MAQPGQQQQHRWYWDGWYQRKFGLWQNRGNEWRGRGWGREGAPWYPRDAVYDANGKVVDPTQVEGWEDAMQAIDNVRARTWHNPQTYAGNVLN